MAGGRLDPDALLLGLTTVQAGEELVIGVVCQGIPEGVLVGELLGNVSRISPGRLGRVRGPAAGFVVSAVVVDGAAAVVGGAGVRIGEQ